MPVRFAFSRGLVLAGVILVGACTDYPDATAPRLRPLAPATLARPDTIYPNAHRYRQQSYTHATGRAGRAVLTARALLGQDGVLVVDATTGQLDLPGPPGSLTKVQVKLLTAGGELQRTLNYGPLAAGGTFSASFPARPRYSFVRLQANVDGIDPRIDVVTATERVNLRPDVAVLDLHAPREARMGDPVLVTAELAELNGDVGATVACVLRVDGTEVDRIPGVWVAEGDVVTCEFLRAFPDPGTYTLDVAAEQAVPGDWDLSNNDATATVDVVGGEQPLHGSASFSGSTSTDTIQQSYESLAGNGSRSNNVTQQVTTTAVQSGLFTATAGPLQPPLAAGSTVSIVTDGGTALAFDLGGLDRTRGDPTCGRRLSAGNQVVLCFGTLSTSVNISHSSTRSTYYSHTVYQYWDAADTYYHSEESSSMLLPGSGVAPDVRDAVAYHVHLADGKNAWGADPTVALVSSVENQLTQPPCTLADDGWIWEQTCTYRAWIKRTYSGSTTF